MREWCGLSFEFDRAEAGIRPALGVIVDGAGARVSDASVTGAGRKLERIKPVDRERILKLIGRCVDDADSFEVVTLFVLASAAKNGVAAGIEARARK